MHDELRWLDATATAALVRDGELTPLEAVESAIGRAEALREELGFVAEPMFDRARDAASTSDPGRPPNRLPSRPLDGVPMMLKDHLATHVGVRHSSGSRYLRDYVAPEDSELVTRFKSAGLIPIATSVASEFALLSTGESELHGPCRNPWDPTRIAGGSSGGAAAAVATGVVPVAHGNDAGGSLRIPAGACGLFGLKPTRARTPLGPAFGDLVSGIWVEHVLTRSVRDSALVLDQTAYPGTGDPYAAITAPGHTSYVDAASRAPGRLRLGFTADAPPGVRVAPECLAALEDAAALCESLGHIVEDVHWPFDLETFDRAFAVVYSTGAAWMLRSWMARLGREPHVGELEPYTQALVEFGATHAAADYLLAIETFQHNSRAMAKFHQTYDVVLCPTTATPPPSLGAFAATADDPLQPLYTDARYAAYTWIANATGAPAMSVPLYWTSDDLPVGVHFQAAIGGEDVLFSLAAQLERAKSWAGRHPAGLGR